MAILNVQKRQTDNAHQGALFQKQKRRKMKNLSSSRRTNLHRKISRNTSLYIKNIVLAMPDGLDLHYFISRAIFLALVKKPVKIFW